MVTFTEEIFNVKPHLLCSDLCFNIEIAPSPTASSQTPKATAAVRQTTKSFQTHTKPSTKQESKPQKELSTPALPKTKSFESSAESPQKDGQTPTASSTLRKTEPPTPSIRISNRRCHIKGGVVYFDATFVLREGIPDNIYMCYMPPESSMRCTEFTPCEREVRGLREAMTCKGMDEWNPNQFSIYLMNENADSITLYKDFVPAIDRTLCSQSKLFSYFYTPHSVC